jgi:ribosomal protein L28
LIWLEKTKRKVLNNLHVVTAIIQNKYQQN